MIVKYQNYKRFGAETSITFGDEVRTARHAETEKQ